MLEGLLSPIGAIAIDCARFRTTYQALVIADRRWLLVSLMSVNIEGGRQDAAMGGRSERCVKADADHHITSVQPAGKSGQIPRDAAFAVMACLRAKGNVTILLFEGPSYVG